MHHNYETARCCGGWVVAAAVLLFAGCSQSLPQYDMQPVQGVVRMDGRPIANAKVVFHSESLPSSLGTTDSAGAFTLATPRYGDGAAPGEYLVQVHSAGETSIGDSGKSISIPHVYGESGLKVVEVTASGENQFQLELKSRPGSSDYLTNNPFAEP